MLGSEARTSFMVVGKFSTNQNTSLIGVKSQNNGAGEMVQWSRALAALPEDRSEDGVPSHREVIDATKVSRGLSMHLCGSSFIISPNISKNGSQQSC